MELVYIDENNLDMLADYTKRAAKYPEMRTILESKFKNNATVLKGLHDMDNEQESRYDLVNKCIHEISVIQANSDFNINDDFCENSFREFTSIDKAFDGE